MPSDRVSQCMWLALVSAEFLTAIAMLVLLVGVPVFVLAVLAIVSGVLQHDADEYLESLETDDDGTPISEDDSR